MADENLDLKDGICKVKLKKSTGKLRDSKFWMHSQNGTAGPRMQFDFITTVKLGYNVMAGTEYFVSL
jgi:hypothetical protein